MPFTRRSTFALTLAVNAALVSTFASAKDSFSTWNCQANKDTQTWECSSGSQQAPSNRTAVKTNESAVISKPAKTSKAPERVSVQSTSSAAAVSVTPAVAVETTPPSAPVQTTPARKTTSGTPQQREALNSKYALLDWFPYSAAEQAHHQCKGRYIEPAYTDQAEGNTANQPIHLEAGQSSTVIGGLSQLEGGVEIRQGNRRFSAALAELDQVTNKASLEGDVRYREPGLLMLSDRAQVDTVTSEAIFNNAQFVIHEERLRGSANRIIRLEDERLRLEQGKYTYCPPGNQAWLLDANNIVLNKDKGFGEAKNTVLKVGGVPILYVPYFTFPIDDTRRSGFLYPSISYSQDSGLDLAVPYYFNIQPNMDNTLTTRFISDRGLLFENEFRYLNDWSNNVLSAAYLPEDDTADEDRWLLGIDHQGQLSARWHTLIDYSAVSDADYFDDLSTDLEVARQDHLDKRGEIAYLADGWQFRARMHDYQSIDKDSAAPYKRMPQFTFTGGNSLSQNTNFSYIAELTRFDRNLSRLTGTERVIGDRRFFLPSVNYQWQSPWGHFKPELALWSSSYSLDNQVSGFDDSPTVTAPVFSIDSGLIFERALANGGTQTLEPRLFALYVDEEDQDAIPDFDTSELDFNYQALFRKNRFSGYDRIGDTQQLSLGISSRLFTAEGAETASLSVGQAFYFEDRTVQLNSSMPIETDNKSDIATEAVWYVSPELRASADAILNHSNLDTDEANLRLRYQSDLNHRFDFSYRYEDEVRKQSDLSFIWPVANQWTTMGRWLYDLHNNESLETALGVEYESCCWQVNFAARRWLDDANSYDTGIFLHFTLKGLGSFGSGSDEFLNDIIGYKERNEHNEN